MANRKDSLFRQWVFLVTGLILLLVGAVLFYINICTHPKLPPELVEPPLEVEQLIAVYHTQPNRQPQRVNPSTSVSLMEAKDYADYFQHRLRANPGDQAIALMLEISKRVRDERFQHEMYELFNNQASLIRGNRVTTLTEAQNQCVDAHADILNLVDRFCAMDGPDPISNEELMQAGIGRPYDDYTFNFELDINLLPWNLTYLMTLATVRHLNDNKPHEAQQIMLNMFKLQLKHPARRGSFASEAKGIIKDWVESRQWPDGNWKEIADSLENHKKASPESDSLILKYRIWRQRFVNWIQSGKITTEPLTGRRQVWYEGITPMLRLQSTPLMILSAIKNAAVKQQAPQTLKNFDAQWKAGLELMRKPWREVVSTPAIDIEPSILEEHSGSFQDHLLIKFYREAENRLIRVALEIMRNPQAFEETRSVDFTKDPDNPWSDPFTEKPLQVIEETTCTVIYSLGPDMKDDRAQTIIDTGVIHDRKGDPGDIVIRIPKGKIGRHGKHNEETL